MQIASVVAAGLFALSPVNWSTASYAYARSDVLGTTFALLYLLMGLGPSAASTKQQSTPWRAAQLPLLVLALFTKQTLVALPIMLAAAGAALYWPVCRRWLAATTTLHMDGCFVVALYMLHRKLYFGATGDLEAESLPPLLPYWLSQPYANARCLAMLLVPAQLAVDHHVLVEGSATLGACAAMVVYAHAAL